MLLPWGQPLHLRWSWFNTTAYLWTNFINDKVIFSIWIFKIWIYVFLFSIHLKYKDIKISFRQFTLFTNRERTEQVYREKSYKNNEEIVSYQPPQVYLLFSEHLL